jgi:hypothetical protein
MDAIGVISRHSIADHAPGGVSTPPRARLLLVQGPDGAGYALASNTTYATTGWIKENPTRQILLVVYRGGYTPPAQP